MDGRIPRIPFHFSLKTHKSTAWRGFSSCFTVCHRGWLTKKRNVEKARKRSRYVAEFRILASLPLHAFITIYSGICHDQFRIYPKKKILLKWVLPSRMIFSIVISSFQFVLLFKISWMLKNFKCVSKNAFEFKLVGT